MVAFSLRTPAAPSRRPGVQQQSVCSIIYYMVYNSSIQQQCGGPRAVRQSCAPCTLFCLAPRRQADSLGQLGQAVTRLSFRGWHSRTVGYTWNNTARMLHRHVVRHGKGIFIFALSRRCLPVFTLFLEQPRRHARSLNTNHSSSSRSEAGASMSSVNDSDACSRLSDSGEVLKATPTRSRSRTPSPERPDTNSSSNSTTTSSSSNTTTDSEAVDVRGNKKGLRRSIKELVSQFTKGTKVLWVDFKSSRQTWARKKAGEVLTFQEDRKLRQVRSIWGVPV